MHERDLFIAALEIDDETARRTYLDSTCAGDAELRARVERLLNRDAAAGDFLARPAADLCSDSGQKVLTELSESPFAEQELRTMLGDADNTGKTVLVNLENDAASAVAASIRSPLTDEASAQGTLFGRYRIERVLGSGGMGVVYLAEDLRLGRRVALKIPKFDADADGTLHLSERFRREARTMASVLHRNLCPIFDVDEQGGTHYLTMAFIDGETLAQVLKRGVSFTARQSAEFIRKLALALDEAHRAGVVHRDLKPANVMIDRSGEPILMDFGLAWMTHEADSRVTQSGAIVGTPAYMSPEQAEGHADRVGAATDIYSLGAILYELLTGRPIYTGGVTVVLFKLMHNAPTRPSEIRGEIDPKLEEICWKAISRRHEDRFGTAAEFAETLGSFLNDRMMGTSERIVGGSKLNPPAGQMLCADRTELLPQDTGNATIAYSKNPMSSRSKSRIVVVSLLLISLIGVIWVFEAGQTNRKQDGIVLGSKSVETSGSEPIVEHPSPLATPLRMEFASDVPTVSRAAGLKLGDLDGDDDLDVFVATVNGPCLMLRNDGKGVFTDSGQQLGDNASFAVALGDIDGDDDLDAFVGNSDQQANAIWLNDGRGTFQRSSQTFPQNDSNDVALADLDGDEDLDIAVSNWNGFVEIWINDGTGKFASRQTITQRNNTGIALGKLDNDDDVDLVMTSIGGHNQILLNDGTGHFTKTEQNIDLPESTSVALGDLDRDGSLDLCFTSHQGNQVWFNDGHAHFRANDQRFGDGKFEAVELVDLDADHDLDAVLISGGWVGSQPRTVWLNDGHGHFQKGTALGSSSSQSLTSGDLDGDGDADIVFGNLAQPAEVWLNQSNQSTIP